MPRESPFGLAERKGEETGACPVTLLDAFFTDHATFDELCGEFRCGECVATDEDMGFGGEPWSPPDPHLGDDAGDWEIPF